MFTVSQSQLNQLDSLYLDRLIRGIKMHIQIFFPDEHARLDEDGHEVTLREGVRRAQGYGLHTDRNITVFVDFLMTFGAAFPAGHEWGNRILDDNTLAEDQKIDSLLAAIDE